MADFSAVIRRAIDGLSVNTPEERGRIYERARATIQRQLDSVPEGMNRGIFEAQLTKIENSILEIEQEYADAGPDNDVTPEVPEPPAPITQSVPVREPVQQSAPPTPPSNPVEPPAVMEDATESQETQEITSQAPPQSTPVQVPEIVQPPAEPSVEDLPKAVAPPSSTTEEIKPHEPEPEPVEEVIPFQAPEVSLPVSQSVEIGSDGGLGRAESSAPTEAENLDSAEKAIDSELQIPKAPIVERIELDVQPEQEEVTAEPPSNEETAQASIMEPVKAPTKAPITTDSDTDLIDQAVSEIRSTLQEETPDKSSVSDPNLSFGFGEEALPEAPAPKQRKSPVIIIIAVLLLIIVGLAFLFWRVGWQGVQDLFPQSSIVESTEVSTGQDVGEPEEQSTEVTQVEENETPTEDVASSNGEVGKFTQRLNSDGTEVDEGPASDLIDGLPNEEGRSVASADASDDASVSDPIASQVNDGTPALQRMFFYETSLGLEQQARYEGSIVWSEQTESDSQISRPYIEGTIQVPERDLSIVITIKLNGDETLPVSHLIDLNFSLPDEFDGGEIEQITEVKLKNSEEQTGDRLQAISAKIGPSFFVVGLQNDKLDIVESNLQLMSQRGWIDIPISYTNGRKALITLEKGASGTALFDKVLASWRQNPAQ